MKHLKNLLICLLVLSVKPVLAQNAITVDLDHHTVAGANVDFNQDQVITLQGSAANLNPVDPKQMKWSIGNTPSPNPRTLNVNSVTLFHGADLPNPAAPQDVTVTIVRKSDGTGFTLLLQQGKVPQYVGPAFSIYYGPYAYDDTKFFNQTMSEQDYINKYKNLVIFYPCDNRWQIYYNHQKASALHYSGTGNTGTGGAVLLIKDFNTAMYSVSATNSFVSYTSSMPSVFTDVVGLIAPAAGAQANGRTVTFADFARLDQSLKKLLSHDCGDFITAKNSMVDYVSGSLFGGDINAAYQAYLTANTTAAHPVVAKADFDKQNATAFQLKITPDSLIKEDVSLYNAMINSSFIYQYQVPQLQNADQLQFVLNVAPKANTGGFSNTSGAINIVNQSINVPIVGGFRFDFSTGFYYSDVRNQTYNLSNNGTNAMAVKESNDHHGTLGIAGLLHGGYSFDENWMPSIAVGVGKSADQNYALLYGVSAMLTVTGQNKIGISGGRTYASIKTLSNTMEDDSGKPIALPTTVTSVTYVNNFRSGWFVGLTYSFGLSKATQAASPAATPSTTSAASTPGTGGAAAGGGAGAGAGGAGAGGGAGGGHAH